MGVSLSGLIAYARTYEGRKKLRYCGVSTVFVPLGQTLVQGFGLWLDNYTAASLLSAAVVTIPNFFANKYFVWRVMTHDNVRRQMLVFWVAMMLGVSLATSFTHLVEIATAHQTQLLRGGAVFLAQLLGYGIVWVGRFVLLNRWLFKLPTDTPSAGTRRTAEAGETSARFHTRVAVHAPRRPPPHSGEMPPAVSG